MKAETEVGFTLAWGEFSFLPGKPRSRLAITVMHPRQSFTASGTTPFAPGHNLSSYCFVVPNAVGRGWRQELAGPHHGRQFKPQFDRPALGYLV